MSVLESFLAYAVAFEETYADDDWSRLRQYFTEDAVYQTSGAELFAIKAEGLDAVLDGLHGAVNGFDRRFDNRHVELVSDPVEHDGVVTFDWIGHYTVEGAPELTIAGRETAVYETGRIKRLDDAFTPEVGKLMAQWMAEHADRLRG